MVLKWNTLVKRLKSHLAPHVLVSKFFFLLSSYSLLLGTETLLFVQPNFLEHGHGHGSENSGAGGPESPPSTDGGDQGK
ncbi:MAG: hypothetical protein KA436_10310 [Oligoflexales bacterium]|nr:hypothetical protein [Oligoflexales bacterium]